MQNCCVLAGNIQPYNPSLASFQHRCSRVVRAARLWCRKSPQGREFEAGLHHATTGKLSLNGFFELGKAKAEKGEGWAPPFISCVHDTVGL